MNPMPELLKELVKELAKQFLLTQIREVCQRKKRRK